MSLKLEIRLSLCNTSVIVGRSTNQLAVFPPGKASAFYRWRQLRPTSPVLRIWPFPRSLFFCVHLSTFHHSSLKFLTSCSCVLSLLSLFSPVSPLSQAVRSLTVHLSRWHSKLVAGGPDFWVRPAWLFVCNTFTPSLPLFFCCLGLILHAVHFHLSLCFICSVAWLNLTLRSLGPYVIYGKRCRNHNRLL